MLANKSEFLQLYKEILQNEDEEIDVQKFGSNIIEISEAKNIILEVQRSGLESGVDSEQNKD